MNIAIKIFIFIIAILISVIGFGCNVESLETEKEAENIENGTKIVEADNVFDAREAQVGDLVAGMRIENIKIGPSGYPEEEEYSATVEFSGKAVIEGRYVNNTDDEFLGNEVSFIVDDEFTHMLPRLKHDKRYTWFVFSNSQKANKSFAPEGSSGRARIAIDNYIINYAPTEVWNLAKLVEVIKFLEGEENEN
ncbi:MAG: hypothetical protein R6U35_06425 [Candidatus Humimicrobiaceae bacterium]